MQESVMRNILSIMLALAVSFSFSAAIADETGEDHDHPPMLDGAIVHIEIPTTDMAASEEFYGSLFGWQFEPMMEGYHGFSTPDGVAGAFSSMLAVAAESGPVLYIYCADIDSMLPRVEAAGGSVLIGRTPIPYTGWFAWIKDCCGNSIGLFSAEDVPEGEMGMEG
jgi:predicted enzyme related to lactoylglutathione lyase